MPDDRTILHVDMDAFFAAVEVRDDPSLKGKPLLVGGTGNRGVVSTASYEARTFGCHSAMPMSQARRLCPQAIVLKPSFSKYREASNRVFGIFERFTHQIQPLSVDEAFLDVTGSRRLFGDGPTIATAIRQAIRDEVKLTGSVGVAPNKFLAKLASDLNKPDGMTVITRDTVDTILPPLPITRIWGIGKVSAARLNGLGVRTIGDLRARSPEWFDQHLGSWGRRMRDLIHGIDDRPVHSDADAKSIGHEETFGENLIDPDAVRAVLLEQAEAVGMRLRKNALFTGGVTVKIRFGDFKTITRSKALPNSVNTSVDLYAAGLALFDEWARLGFQPVRLVGLQAHSLVRTAQLDLFAQPASERQQKVDAALDAIKTRFGKDAIGRGRPSV
ncbi:MAG: DNA polymerase IV [Tepidisphaeraceae bacterium]